jgi:arsenate reductase
MPISIYHNPRCSKSRQTLQILQDQGHEPTVIEYLQTPPDEATLSELLVMLGIEPIDIMRTNEPEYRAAAGKIDAMDTDGQIRWLAANPRVLQRPIVVNGNQARIGRPPEAVLEILT